MSSSDVTANERTPLWASPGLIVAGLFSLLVVLIAVGVVITNRGSASAETVTIADLRARPDHFDGKSVVLTGTVHDVRQLPVLDQYALYTFRDETGSMWTLSQRGVPPREGETVRLTSVYHSRITLDEQIRSIVEEQFGSLAGAIASGALPNLAINAVFLEHQEYEVVTR